MSETTVTRMVEDYVTLIWKAYELPDGGPTTTDMAARLGVTASTVSANLRKLARDGFIEYEPYGRIELTERGHDVAVRIVRRHRIVETYLVRELGLGWDQVHEEADQLEHAVSELVLERMDAVLGHPSRDPHGDPIPDADGGVTADRSIPLTDAVPNDAVRVSRVSDRFPEVLRYLDARGISVDSDLHVLRVSLDAGVIRVRVGAEEIELSSRAASAVRVELLRR